MSFYALALLCPFVATTFAAVVQGKWSVSSRLIVVCSFPLGALWLRPEPAWVGVLVAVAAGLQLAWPQLPWLAVAVGGLTAGLWGGILTSQGLVMPLAWMGAASFPVASAVLSARRPEFAPAALKEEALLAALALGVLVATGVPHCVASAPPWLSSCLC